MKNYRIFLIGVCLLLSSCALPINYFGDRLAPTNTVDIYYSAHDVTKAYKVIGHLTCANAMDQEKVKTQLSAYAKTIGADAIVITGTDGNKDNMPTVIT